MTYFTWALKHRMMKFASTSFRVFLISHCRALCDYLEVQVREGSEMMKVPLMMCGICQSG